jgi:hypothetical protein
MIHALLLTWLEENAPPWRLHSDFKAQGATR